MGGASSEVSPSTRAVALEAAYWEPLAVRRAAKALGMHTEASHRFERGADPEAPGAATARICHLLRKIDGGSTRPGLIDQRTLATGPRQARLRGARVSLVLGDVVAETESRRILEGLGFAVGAKESEGATVTIPSWRGDVSREIDLVEEVGRYHGLDRIPSTIPSTGVVGGLQPWQVRERAARQAMVAAGLTEVVSYAFVSETEAAAAPGARVALANPLSEEQAVLRNSLVVPGLLGALRANLRQGRRDVAVFEIGRVFTPGEPMPVEERRLGLLLSGTVRPAHWSEKGRPADFFDAKGTAESLLARLGAADVTWTRGDAPPFLQPGKAAVARRGEKVVGYVGAVRPEVAAAFESKDEVLVGELGLDGLLAENPPAERFRALDRFPPVSRDLSVLCDAGLEAAELLAAIRGAAGELLRSVTVIDRYDRPPVPEGRVSLTVTLVFQSQERTLTGEEVQEAVERVVRDLRGRRAEIRGE
jgi:phenylalanyl-tRNA synthetase beta chain